MRSYKLLKTYHFSQKAELDRAKLQDESIDSQLVDSNTVNIAPHYAQAVGGIKLYVPQSDFKKAEKLLSNTPDRQDTLQQMFSSEDLEPVRQCPNCESINVFQEHSFWAGLFFLISAMLPITVPKNKLHCADCDHRWTPQ